MAAEIAAYRLISSFYHLQQPLESKQCASLPFAPSGKDPYLQRREKTARQNVLLSQKDHAE
jgi:hypothetical protein